MKLAAAESFGQTTRGVSAHRIDFPGYYMLIANHHVAEFTDLSTTDRGRCVELIGRVEAGLIDRVRPHKINIASHGNYVPHLHWHIVARFEWDSRFPDAIWAPPKRAVDPSPEVRLGATRDEIDAAIMTSLGASTGQGVRGAGRSQLAWPAPARGQRSRPWWAFPRRTP